MTSVYLQVSEGIPFTIISGPSGVGKSTLIRRLHEEFPGCFQESISHTTRSPRPGEVDGVDYFFVTLPHFQQTVEAGGFLEHIQFAGNYYGTTKKSVCDILKSGKVGITDMAMDGVKRMKAAEIDPEPRYVCILPPSLDELRRRLECRNTETSESLERRMATAQAAIDYASQHQVYHHVIVNDDLDTACNELRNVFCKDIVRVQLANMGHIMHTHL